MTKQEEVHALQSLKGDTYFAQVFGQDIDQMCENVKNDFGIMLNTTYALHLESLEKALKAAKESMAEAQAQYEKNYEELCRRQDERIKQLFLMFFGKSETQRYEIVEELFGRVFALRCKYEENSELYPEEMEELFKLAQGNK